MFRITSRPNPTARDFALIEPVRVEVHEMGVGMALAWNTETDLVAVNIPMATGRYMCEPNQDIPTRYSWFSLQKIRKIGKAKSCPMEIGHAME